MTNVPGKPILDRIPPDRPSRYSWQRSGSLPIIVIFTTTSDTLTALRKAGQLARQLGLPIRILAPHVVPYPLALETPQVDPQFRLRQFRTLCQGEAIQTFIDVHLCRDAERCIRETLFPNSVVLMGVRPSFWPWTQTKRLAKRLNGAGHHVLLVDP